MKKPILILLIFLLGFTIGMFLTTNYVFPSSTNNEVPLEYDGYWKALGTNSMRPLINKDDNVTYIDVTDETSLGIDDIIVYRDYKDELIVHSIVYIYECDNETFYLTRGTNILTLDKYPIKRSQIKRKVVGIIFNGT